MGKIDSHRDLIVWQKAMDLAVQIYRLSSTFPSNELYRLVSQIIRAAASIPANIAEGHAGNKKRLCTLLGCCQRVAYGNWDIPYARRATRLCEWTGRACNIKLDYRNQ